MRRALVLMMLLAVVPTVADAASTACVVRAPRDGSLVQVYRYDASLHPEARFYPAEVWGDAGEVDPASTGDGYLNVGAMLLGRWTKLVMHDVQPRGIYSSTLTEPIEVTPPVGGFVPGAGEPDRYPYDTWSYSPYADGIQWLVVWFDVGGRTVPMPPAISAEVAWDFRIPGGCDPVATTSDTFHLDHRSFPGAQTMTPVAGMSDWMDRMVERPFDLVVGGLQHGTFTDPRHALRANDTCTDRLFYATPTTMMREERVGIAGIVDTGGGYPFRYWYRCLTPNLNGSLVGINFS